MQETERHLAALSEKVQAALSALQLPEKPENLYDPVRYILSGGGKRIRPILLLLAAEAFGVRPESAMPGALAVEVFHNFTLVHDDIMDQADTRRARATVHQKWNPNVAILSGDVMMGLSYDLLAQIEDAPTAKLIRRFHQMVFRLCEGQTLDMDFETRQDVTLADYLDMIDGKTAALLMCALEMGGILGGANEHERAALNQIGQQMGLAFQIQDDYLDLMADQAAFGKVTGGDLIQGKRTWLLLTALEKTAPDAPNWFRKVLHGGLEPADIPEARVRLAELGVLGAAEKTFQTYYEDALRALTQIPQNVATDTLRAVIQSLQNRTL